MKSDLELMEEFKRGDRNAFHKLIRRHHVAVLNFFYPLCGMPEFSEELTQDVFLRIFNDLDPRTEVSLWKIHRNEATHPTSRFSTYLMRTAYLCWSEYLRHNGSPVRALVPAGQASAGLATTDSYALLAPVAEELKPVMVLAEIGGFSYAEIGVILHLPPNMVRHRMKEGYAQLQASVHARAAGAKKTAAAGVSGPETGTSGSAAAQPGS
ncbi:MAG TPA: RNA polymerase sigma factor [Planctomycetota bacterium]|nr:RNA polymerase sigma factor [Planctomycetota bacterium]